jgi:NADPH-dependent curcumin reductase
MLPTHHRRIVLASRPVGEPVESDFGMEEVLVPEPGPGQVLVRVLYLSLDPYMRGRMRDAASYAPPVEIGGVMTGGAVGQIVASQASEFSVGDIVEGRLGWQEFAVGTAASLRRVDRELAPVSTANGILGMPGMTAYCGLFEIGNPKVGETVVVSAASGAVGQVVGQLAKRAGCHVVGIAGGARKCSFVIDELGFDACIDYKMDASPFEQALATACPNGIDVYFDNVGGVVSDAVILQLNVWARIVLCGAISQYNSDEPEMAPRLPAFFVGQRVIMRGFIVSDFAAKFDHVRKIMGALVRDGHLKYREDIVDGLENAPRAFIGLLRGENFGKLQVRVSSEDD